MKIWKHHYHQTEVNLDKHLTIKRWDEDYLKIHLPEDLSNHNFYEVRAPSATLPETIRWVFHGEMNLIEACAEYELMRTLPEDAMEKKLVIASYLIPEDGIIMYDDMPADHYMEVDENGFAKDQNYSDKSAYHPEDIPIPKYDKLPVGRIYSPYGMSNNPYFVDKGLWNVDIQYAHNNPNDIWDVWVKAVKAVAEDYGFEVMRKAGKLYFKHGDRWVKFESSAQTNGVLGAYINLNSAYNKAYDFYKPGLEKDIRDQYSYGLCAVKKVDENFVKDCINRFAKFVDLPIFNEPYSSSEIEQWKKIQVNHKDTKWIIGAERKDAAWYVKPGVDGFEHEWILSEQPKSNIFKFKIEHSGLDFHYQPALTKDEIGAGNLRAPNVVGSYAVYHKHKKHQKYETGKFCHIYRPVAKDSDGKSYFCNINIAKNEMTVEVPTEFLKSAKYPVIVDPTFGYQSAGASTTQYSSGSFSIIQTAITGITGQINQVVFYGQINAGTSNTIHYNMSIYDNATLSRLAYTSGYTYSTGTGIVWNSFPINLTTSASNQYVIRAMGRINTSGAYILTQHYYDSSTATSGTNTSTNYSNPPPANIALSNFSMGTNIYSMYATTNYSGNTMLSLGVG